ncbi:MAG: PAS domain S-box protein [Methanobacterium sp.]|jgi:PAS domain S-box-containing protein
MLKNSIYKKKSLLKDNKDYFSDDQHPELMDALKEEDELIIIDEVVSYSGRVDYHGIIQYLSPSLECSLGYKDSDVLGKSIFDSFEFMHPDDMVRTKDSFYKCVTKSSHERIHARFKHANGNYVFLEVIIDPVLNDENIVTGVVFSSHDITKHKIMEKKLQISQEHFKSIFYQSPIATAIITMDQRFITVNQQFLNLTGYSQEDLQSLSILDIVHPEDVESNRSKMQLLINGDIEQHRTEKRYIRKNGEIVWVSLSVSLIHDEEGLPIHFMSMIEDITERKQIQEEMEASFQEIRILLSEIHHRVFNHLQLILKLVNVQLLNTEEKGMEINKINKNRLNAITLIHEKLSKSQDFAIIDFADYIICLKNHLIESYNINSDILKFEIETDNSLLDVDIAIPCALILNELIIYRIIHAFPEDLEGKIIIKYSSDGGKINLNIIDNGIIIEDSEIKNNGLKLVDMLVKQLDGKLIVDDAETTEFRIEFLESVY